ncbi:MAG: BON domain-containing protein [Burkholderiaceae bacterium]|jgi:osmotically-inducible protein OsmY|nr:BON domain-containing protein [Burkholderiaceae bacterium]
MKPYFRIVSRIAGVLAAIVVTGQLAGCAVAVIGGAAGAGTLIVTAGRRSSETASADSRIESQASNAVEQVLGGHDHHVTVTSYYRKVLLTGEVISKADRARAQTAAQGVQGVQGVFNDLAVMPLSSAFSRSQDAYITSKVKARFLNTNGVPAASIKVVTERGTVYLMGRLTRQEAELATDAVQQVGGVQRVARIIDFVPDSAMTEGTTGTTTSGGSDTDITTSGSGVNDVAPPVSSATPEPSVETHPIAPSAIEQKP